ncbi:hypothetical protein SEVIR_3G389400v4 [Setaria viridis]|uniref:TF-B3 domain-containing protein n=1 Tax=Setaria viridis TaxID=4556 RepID=A0A4U6VK53_SETVI|nr:B3 domain-containing protein Os12g0592300-like [Setaria viridis]TKW29342.1 hypothetical protein SEVIR_3G389400v2 [Setaria viridis]
MMVDKRCESCRKWQEHYYWEHMDVTKIRFFKLMTGDFAKGISIPDKFAKNLNGIGCIDLKAPSGETWNIGLEKHADELFLMSRWEDFVKAHVLKENDLLIFTYSGNSSFDVLIFEASGCEKVSSLFGNRTAPDLHKHFDYMADRGKQAEHYALTDSKETTAPSQLAGFPHHASTSKKSGGRNPRQLPESPNSSNNHVKCDDIREEDSDEEYAKSKYCYTRIAERLSDEEKEEIISLASIRSDNPAFVTVLQMSHVRRKNNFLIFPNRFVADHFDSRLHEITLVRPNRKDKWCVKYYYARSAQGVRNYTFSKFVQENRLREGDICAFELMKGSRRVTMTVHAIRKVHGRFVLVG